MCTSAGRKDGKLKVVKHPLVNIKICFSNLSNMLTFKKSKPWAFPILFKL